MTLKHRELNKGKKLRINEAELRVDFDQEKPTFCLRYLDPAYCISKCDKEEKAAFVDKIYRMSQMTWIQLRMADRHKMGSETIAKTSIKRPIPPHVTADVQLLAFRFCGMKPMVGYRKAQMFHILWFDRDFTLYDHG